MHLRTVPKKMGNPACINNKLTDAEIAEIDFRLMGQIIYDQTFTLSKKVNTELLEPISQWLDDSDWMVRFQVYEQDIPNWAEYKRKQREWNEAQKQLLAERMKAYWQEIHRRKNLRKVISAIIPRTSKTVKELPDEDADLSYLAAILDPLSPQGEKKTETREMFIQARQLSAADILPWKLIIQSHLNTNPQSVPFTALPSYFDNKKADTAAKLTHLLFLESEGKLCLSQHEPFGDISIEPNTTLNHTQSDNSNQPDGCFIIIDQDAEEYPLNWNNLSDAQKNKVITDLKDNRIICKVTS